MIPPECNDPPPVNHFDAWLREVDAREAAQPRRTHLTWPQRVAAFAIGLALWGVILAGLSRAVMGWP